MRTGNTKLAIIITLMFVVSSLSMVSVLSDDSKADDVAKIVDMLDGDKLEISAGGTEIFEVYVMNMNVKDSAAPHKDKIIVYLSATVVDSNGNKYDDISLKIANASTDVVNGGVVIEGADKTKFIVQLSADRISQLGDYTLKYTLKVNNYDDTTTLMTTNKDVKLHVNTDLSTAGNYNKYLGYIDNPFAGTPLGNVWITSIVSFFAWCVIGIVVMMIAVPIVTYLTTRKDDPDRPVLRKALIRDCEIIIVVFAAVNALCVLGVNERTTNDVKTLAHLVYLFIGAKIVWAIYKTFLDRLSERMRGRDMIPGGEVQEFESFKPLFLYIGEILIAVITVFAAMSMLGFDMTAIITSAGIVSLGITFGAQQVLSQFFAGLVILTTRPFKKGDLIQVGSGTVVYRIRKVTVMNTELENWDNSDITIMPNNSLTSSAIKNITRDTLRCKIHLFMDVSYNTDLKFARAAMLEVANAHPRVIKDGSVGRPSTRVVGFADSNVNLRLTVWVDDYNDSGSIGGDLRQAMFDKFNSLGIAIDYPQVVLHEADPEVPTDEEAPSSENKDKASTN